VLAAAQSRIAVAHKEAREISVAEGDAAPPAAVDKSFEKAEKSLGSASTGFQPTVAPGHATPVERKASDPDAQRQIKHNQADSVQLAQ